MTVRGKLITFLTVFLFILIVLIISLLLNRKYQKYSGPEQNLTLFVKQRDAYEYAIKEDRKYSVSEDPVTGYLNYVDNPGFLMQLQGLKAKVMDENERQRLINNKRLRGLEFDHTVLVIRVRPNTNYLVFFFDSIRRIIGIRKSLLIFAHDQYDEATDKAIKTMQFARVLQIFYPYSIQLHPNVYPGNDGRFCSDLNVCFDSKKRDAVLAQEKLFWWWMANQVFDHIGILRNYYGYIYFLESDLYLTKDFIVMAKLLERQKNIFCSECRILSLGSSSPSVELYRPLSTTFIISAWGWSNYSNSGFGLNRTTWSEIRSLKHQFCYFKDPSWENSLKHLASKTPEEKFYMLYIEAPRYFPLTGCGAFRMETDCDLATVYRDIITFVAQIRYWEGTQTFSVKLDTSVVENEVEGRGQWGDARDIDLCMLFSSVGRREYY